MAYPTQQRREPQQRRPAPPYPIFRASTPDIFSSLPPPLSSPTHNVNYAELRASAEALLLLNTTGQDITSNAEKENVNPVVTEPIVPISAPRPLSYAVKGKAAFRSILSVGEGEEDSSSFMDPSSIEELPVHHFQAIQQLPSIPTSVQDALPQHFQLPSLPTVEQPSKGKAPETAKPPMIIRPITPSTIMALTEPCLMNWCYRVEEDDQIQIPIAANIASLHALANLTNMLSNRAPSGQNPWGY